MEQVIAKLDDMIQKGEANKQALEQKFSQELNGVKSEIKSDVESVKTSVSVVKDELDTIKGEFNEMKKKNGALKVTESQKSLQDVIAENVEKNHDTIQKFIRKEIKEFGMDLGAFNQKAVADVSTANVTGGTVWGAQYKPGIITNPNQITHIRQLLSVSPAGPGTDYYFMKENGAGEGAPAPVAEAATASQFDVDLVESSVKFEQISGFMVASNKSLNNIPGFVSFLQKRIPEKLMDVEDAQILYGDGSTPNIKGILTAGNYTAGSAAGATALVEKIINDLSTLEDTHKRLANGIAMRPADYYTFFKNKASGSGEYDLPQGVVFVNGVLYILGVPVAKTTALTTNDYVVGDWNMGAELLVQEGLALEFFREDGNNVRKNQVTIRIQETIALPVYGSNYFLLGDSGAV